METIQCVCCQERFCFDNALCVQPATTGRYANTIRTQNQNARQQNLSNGEPRLCCPRCQTDNYDWLRIRKPNDWARIDAIWRNQQPAGGNYHRQAHRGHNVAGGVIFPLGMIMQVAGNDDLMDQLVPPYPGLRRAFRWVILVLAGMLALVFWIPLEPVDQIILIVLMVALALSLVNRITSAWISLRDWYHLRRIPRRTRRDLLPRPVFSAIFIILLLAVGAPLIRYVGVAEGVELIERIRADPEATIPQRANELLEDIEEFNTDGQPLQLATETSLDSLSKSYRDRLELIGGMAIPLQEPQPVQYRDMQAWMGVLLVLGITVAAISYWGTMAFIKDEMEQLLPRPLFRDLSSLTRVALDDAQHALSPGGVRMGQVQLTSLGRNDRGGLRLLGQLYTGHMERQRYEIDTDIYGRIVEMRVVEE